MQIFQQPLVIILILVFCFLLLGGVGIYLAVRGINIANGEEENGFSNMRKLEKRYFKSGDLRENRCVFYINIFLDNHRSVYSETQTAKLYSAIKQLLLSHFSRGQMSAISSYGENKFVVYTKLDTESAKSYAEDFQTVLNKCFLEHNALNIAENKIGAFFAFGSHVSFDEAIKRAKQACLFAKNNNLPYVEWNINVGKSIEKKIKIENNIESEIDNNRFFLEYQPVLDAKTKEIIGAEVLSRLNSETDGVLTPKSFLSAVDSVGLNNKFDYYIFEKNCKWISNDKTHREGYKYTINFSRSTLCEPTFAEKIVSIAEKYDLKMSCLAVEILEDKDITGDAKKQMIENLATLKEKGISVLLDDFGTGYTTFGDLQSLDISIIKIDRSITQNSTTETGFIILQNIIRTAKDIGFKTLCEGVETKEHEDAVIKAGCDLLQGYYYYRPMSVTKLESLFEQKQHETASI